MILSLICSTSLSRDLLLRGIEGNLRLRVEVGIDGKPQSVEIARSSGYASMD